MKSRPRKHRGIISSARGRRYVLDALQAALADPATAPHCQLRGGLFPGLEAAPPSVELAQALFANRHPVLGTQLKRRVSEGRLHDGGLKGSACHGFTVTLTVSPSVSIAALVLGDPVVRTTAFGAITTEFTALAGKTDRRQPRPRVGPGVLPTGKAALLTAPDVAGRSGQPLLHVDGTFFNLTGYTDGLRQRYCAAHFRRIARGALSAQHAVDRRVFRELKKRGYAVRMERGRCEIDHVAPWLRQHWNTNPVEPVAFNPRAYSAVDLRRRARQRDDAYLLRRGPKVMMPLAARQLRWMADLGVNRMESCRRSFDAGHRPSSPRHARDIHIIGQADPHDSDDSVLRPILTSTLRQGGSPLAASPPPPAAMSCTEVIAVTQGFMQCSIPLLVLSPRPDRVQIAVHGDPARTPWLGLLRDLVGIAFPGAIVTIHKTEVFPPRLRLEQGDGALRGLVAAAGTRLVEDLAGLPTPALRQLGTLIAVAHEDTRTLRIPELPGNAVAPARKHFQPDPEIDLHP